MRWGALWLALMLMPVFTELVALVSPASGDTLTEQIVPSLMRFPWLWWGTFVTWIVFVSWMTYHLWFQYRDREK